MADRAMCPPKGWRAKPGIRRLFTRSADRRDSGITVLLCGFLAAAVLPLAQARAQWLPNGTPIVSAPNTQQVRSVLPDGSGGVIVAWNDGRSGTDDIYLQRLTGQGTTLWQPNGVRVCPAPGARSDPAMALDGSGGAFVVWVDRRDDPAGDIYVQRVTSSGTPAPGWAVDGLPIASGPAKQQRAGFVSDGAGGVFVVWEDNPDGSVDVRLQRITAAGTVASGWPSAGLAIVDVAAVEAFPAIASNGSGGVVIVWSDARTSGYPNTDIYAQRVDGTGTVLWSAGGKPVSAAAGRQTGPRIIEDGAAGCFVAWDDYRTSGDIYAKRLTPTGDPAPGWSPDGTPVCTASGDQTGATLALDGAGGVYVTWNDRRHDAGDAFLQRLNGDGSVAGGWLIDGLAVSTGGGSQTDVTLVADATGTALLAWQDGDVHAQRVLPSGTVAPAWPVGGITVSDAPSYQIQPLVVTVDPDHAVIVWNDGRNESQNPCCVYDVYAQHVRLSDGLVGAVSGTVHAAIEARPDTLPATLRGLQGVRVQVFQAGVPIGTPAYTDVGGRFSVYEQYGSTDVVRATLSSAMNEASGCAAPPPSTCNPGNSAFHEASPGEAPPIDLLWPTSGSAADEVAHAFYFAEKVGRDYWADVMGVPPSEKWKVVVRDETDRVARVGGALADPCEKEMHFRTEYARYPDVIYHEFTHRMIAQVVGTSLRGLCYTPTNNMAASMDEGLADYFAASFANEPQIKGPSGVLRDLNPTVLPSVCFPGTPPGRNWCVKLQTCAGTFWKYNARVFGCALWELRKRLIDRGRGSAEVDRWIWGAIAPFAERIPEPADRTFLEFYRQLRDYTLWGTTYEPELTAAFAKFNIKDEPDAVCYIRPFIQGVDRVVSDGQLYATAGWGTVPGATGYNVYVRTEGTGLGLDLGMLVAASIQDTFYSYVDGDTAATVAFFVTAIDSMGEEGPESEETPLITGVPPSSQSPVLQVLRAWPNPSRGIVHLALIAPQTVLAAEIYDLTGRRMVRALWQGRRIVQAFDWDGRDDVGRRVPSGIYFLRVRLGKDVLNRRVVLLD